MNNKPKLYCKNLCAIPWFPICLRKQSCVWIFFCDNQEVQDLKCGEECFRVYDGFMYMASLNYLRFFITLLDHQEWLCPSLHIFHLQLQLSFRLWRRCFHVRQAPIDSSSGKWLSLSLNSSVSSTPVLEHGHFLPCILLVYFMYFLYLPYQIISCLRVFLHHLDREILCIELCLLYIMYTMDVDKWMY